jgi:hypothetical protein
MLIKNRSLFQLLASTLPCVCQGVTASFSFSHLFKTPGPAGPPAHVTLAAPRALTAEHV